MTTKKKKMEPDKLPSYKKVNNQVQLDYQKEKYTFLNNHKISLTIVFVGILSMIFSGAMNANSVNGQMLLDNEKQQLLQQQQYQQQQLGNPITTDPSYMEFLKFMQLMQYYEQVFGKDYVTKIYKNYYDDDDDDDDDDNDNDHDDKKNHHKKKW